MARESILRTSCADSLSRAPLRTQRRRVVLGPARSPPSRASEAKRVGLDHREPDARRQSRPRLSYASRSPVAYYCSDAKSLEAMHAPLYAARSRRVETPDLAVSASSNADLHTAHGRDHDTDFRYCHRAGTSQYRDRSSRILL